MENDAAANASVLPSVAKRKIVDGKKMREEKRLKWSAKQERKNEKTRLVKEREEWLEGNAHYATFLKEEDVKDIRERLDSCLGERLRPYVDIIVDKKTAEGDDQLFIAEGTETVRLLIQQTFDDAAEKIKVKSIFCKPNLVFQSPVNLMRDIDMAKVVNGGETSIATIDANSEHHTKAPPFHLLLAEENILTNVAGFPVTRGILGCGYVPKYRDEMWLNDFLKNEKESGKPIRLLALDGICDTSNMGSMIRCASAFGISAVVLSNDCCDAWYRRAVRVSMGHVFKVPTVRVTDLASTIQKWSQDPLGITTYAAIVESDANLVLEDVGKGDIPEFWCCCFGNEGNGMAAATRAACNFTIRIGMVPGVDSLSVPIATGILLHGLKEREAALAAG